MTFFDQPYSAIEVGSLVVLISAGLLSILTASAAKPLGVFARLGLLVTIIGLYALILVPEQARVIAFAVVFVGSFAMALNRWDERIPGVSRKPRP